MIEKLAAFVPPPRFKLVRYYGVLAPSVRRKPLVIPSEPEPTDSLPHPKCAIRNQIIPRNAGDPQKKPTCRPRNCSSAELIRRVFALDVLECDRCGSPMPILATIYSPEAIRKILDCPGLPSRAPPIAPVLPDRDIDELYSS